MGASVPKRGRRKLVAENCVTFMEVFLVFSVSRIRIKYEKYDKGVWIMEEDIYIYTHIYILYI